MNVISLSDMFFALPASLSVSKVLKIISARKAYPSRFQRSDEITGGGGKVSVLVGEVVESGYCSKLHWTW
jgi:hypothetical protein